MVVGYLDIFVFEELVFAVGPVVDGIDGAFKGYARVVWRMKSTVAKRGRVQL